MTKKTRKMLFYASIAIFIVLSATMITFALGLRYDIKNNRFVKTGSISVKVNNSASVYVNEKLKGKTSFLDNTFVAKNILPGNYSVKVKRADFRSWQKDVSVKGGLISDFSRVVIIPETLEENILIKNLSIGTKVVWSQDLKKAIGYNGQKLFRIDLTQKNLQEIEFNWPEDIASSFNSVIFYDNQIFFRTASSSLESFDLTSAEEKTLLKNINSFLIKNDTLFFTLQNDLWLYESKPDGSGMKKILKYSFSKNNKIQNIAKNGASYFILLNNRLFGFNGEKLEKIADDVNSFELFPDGSNLAWATSHELWLLRLRDQNFQPLKKAGDKELITRIGEKITNIDWYKDSGHIIFYHQGGVTMIETDTRGGANSYDIPVSGSQIFYNLDLGGIIKLDPAAISILKI